MSITNGAREALARIEIGDDLHASVEHDTKGNPVIVIIAPLNLDGDDAEQ